MVLSQCCNPVYPISSTVQTVEKWNIGNQQQTYSVSFKFDHKGFPEVY